jgi:hypothetical protein
MLLTTSVTRCLLSYSLFILSCNIAAATQIATFTDDACQNSFRSLNGPNGYPNGTCTNLRFNGPIGSFQVVQEDIGCAGKLSLA